MPAPSPRNSIRIARGSFNNLTTSLASIGEGELCYAYDRDKFYIKVNGSLVEAGASGGGDVASVNGQTGTVVLSASDVGAASSEDLTALDARVFNNETAISTIGGQAGTAVQPGDNVSGLTNDAGYITSAEVPTAGVTSVNGDSGPVVTLDASDVGAATASQGALADSAIQPGIVNPVYFANQAAFPDATANHGAVAHSHADGAMYFAHGGVWSKLANDSEIPVDVSELNNDVGYLTTETVNNIDVDALPSLP